jgi:hypothetical protein
MTEAEVEAIFGKPGDYRNADDEYEPSPEHQPVHEFGKSGEGSGAATWYGDGVEITIDYGPWKNGQREVVSGIFCYRRPKSLNVITNMDWRAERWWRSCINEFRFRSFSSPVVR